MAHALIARSHPSRAPIFEEQFNTSGELLSTYFMNCRGRENLNPLWAYIIPIRTQNFRAFSEDLFLPTLLITKSYKISEIANTLLTVVGFILGCLTLPIRLITAIPRYLDNKFNRTSNLFYKYLKGHGVSDEQLKDDRVILEVQWPQRGEVLGPDFIGNYRGSCKKSISFIEQLPSIDGDRASISHTAVG